jgi:AcrR family transcriptional regulator
VLDAVTARGPDIGMDDVAAVSGIAKPVFYRYFADKADLFLAAGRRIAEDAVDEVKAAIDEQSSPHAMVAAGIDAFLHRIEAHPDHYRFASRSAAVGRQPGADPVGDYASVVGLHATRVIAEFLRLARLDAGAAEPWGFGVVGLVKAAADRWLDQPTISRAALGDYLTDLVWSGLRRPRQVSSRPAAGKGQQLRVVARGGDN